MTYDEISDMLTIDNILTAFDCGIIRAYREDPDDAIQLRFCHTSDPDGVDSYFDTDMFWDEWRDDQTDEESAAWVREFLLELIVDDPETYEDEVSFYAYLIEEAGR